MMADMKIVKAPTSVTIPLSAFDRRNDTAIYWLGSAGFLLNCRGTVILIDPVLTTQPGRDDISETGLKMSIPYPIKAAEVCKADIILYTHPDNDHLGPDTASTLAKLNPHFIGPHTVFRKLANLGINPYAIETCRTGDRIEIGVAITIEVTPADHPWQLQDPKRCGKPFRSGDCCGFILTTPDGRFFFPGDTRLMEEHLYIKDIDVLALDVSLCAYHLNHPGAIVLANSLPDALLIPIHYGTYDAPNKAAHCGDPADVFVHVTNAEKRARILAPGQPIILKDRSEQ